MLIGISVIIIVLLLLTPFADPNPDGLESAAEEYDAPEGNAFDLGFLTDYGAEGSIIYEILQNEMLTVIISGIIGVVIVSGLFLIPIFFIRRRSEATS